MSGLRLRANTTKQPFRIRGSNRNITIGIVPYMATGTQSENSKITPNTTQVPNLYLDQYMAFLTGEEWKVLSYTVRRTMGFHKQSDQISLSQYASGLTTKDGKRLDFGTGLSKPAVAKAVVSLVSFGLLIEVKPPRGNAGGVYALQLDDTLINHTAIMNRSNEQSKKNGRRTSNMRLRLVEQRAVSATDCNQSDNPVAVSATDRSAISATNTQKKGKESLGNKDSTQPAIAVAPAFESQQPIEPESKREGSEVNLPPIVKEPELKTPLQSSAKVSPPDGFTVAYSDHADGRHVAHLFKATVKQPSKCVKCHASLDTWSQVAGELHTYEPCCDWHTVDPTWTPEVKDALAKLCKKDWSIPAHKKAMNGCLASVSQREPVTIEALRRFYSNWYKCIYKGIQGNAPEPYEVTSKWVELTESDNCKEKATNGNIKNGRYQPDDYGYDVDPILSRD